MITRTKLIAATLGLLVAGGAVAEASAATVVTRTHTVAAHAIRPVIAHKTVTIVHRLARPHLAVTRILPGHRLAPRIKVARAIATRHVVRTTVVR